MGLVRILPQRRNKYQHVLEATSELQAASLLPSDDEALADKWVKYKNDMWNILCEIKSDVSKILAENIALKKLVQELKSSLQVSDTQIASLKQTVDNIATTVKKCDKESSLRHYISQVEDRVYDLELNLDSLEQYTRNITWRSMEFQRNQGKLKGCSHLHCKSIRC